MFSAETIELSEFQSQFGLDVQRNCRFTFVGKIPTLLERRVVPCLAPQHVEEALRQSGIVGIITTPENASLVPEDLGLALSGSPVVSAMELHEHLASIPDFQWSDFATRVHPDADIHPRAEVAAKNVVIGPRTSVGPGSVIRERSLIGADCHIGESIVVGLDALELFPGKRRILRQSGGVRLADRVTLLAKCTVVRATFGGFTFLDEGTVADVLIHIAHDCQIGKRVTLVACAEISGRCVLGDDAYIGPNACLRNGVTVGSKATVSMGSVVTRDVPDGATVSGNFAVDHAKWLSFVKKL